MRQQQPPPSRSGTLVKFVLLLALCLALWFLLPRPPELDQLPGIIASTNTFLLGLLFLLLILNTILRALRLHIIIQGGQPLSRTFHIANVGTMANSLLPLRAGEFCMAALLAKQLPGGAAEALSKLLADRLLDILTVGGFFLAALLLLIPSGHAAQGNAGTALSTALALVGVMAALALVIACGPWLAERIRVVGRRMDKNLEPLAATLHAAVEGLRSLFRKGIFLRALGLSLVIWLVVSLSFLTGMLMLDLPGSYACAVLAMCFTIAGLITVPLPAGLGSIHGAIVIALSLFAVPFEQALAFAIVYHALTTAVSILLGLLGLKSLKLNFSGLKRLATTGHSAPPSRP